MEKLIKNTPPLFHTRTQLLRLTLGFGGGDVNLYGYVWQNPLRHTDPSGLDGWTGDLADTIDAQLERLRGYLTGLDPDAVNANTVLNYAFNTYKGAADLLRVGRGFGNYYYGRPCTVPADELFRDIGRASGIVLLLAGPAAGVSGHLRGAGSLRTTPGPVSAETGASNAANARGLRAQLAGEEIASGHAFDKHVIQGGEFSGITTRPQFAAHIENVINRASASRELSNGRTAYWDSSTGTVVIRNPSAIDGGTAFKPTQGKTYFDNLQ